MTYSRQPPPFFDVLVHELTLPSLSGLSVGYERETWRSKGLIDAMLNWLPEFGLSYTEYKLFNPSVAVQRIREIARRIYQSDKFKRRGEFGELILHAAIREVFKSEPAASKIFYKDSANDTVKGFDSVHVVIAQDKSLELWLGEVKFYKDIAQAITDVVLELEKHNKINFLRDEFVIVGNKIDPQYEHADSIKKLLGQNNSLDEIFKCVKIPVLLTYDSEAVLKYKENCAEYKQSFKEEVMKHYASFCSNTFPKNLSIHLFLLPLHSKERLQQEFDEQLKKMQ